MSYYKGLGGSIGEGLAAFTQQYIGRQDQLKQQGQQDTQLAQQEAQRVIDNSYRDRQAEEQRRQFEAQSKQARDSQAFQFLSGQQSQMTAILAKGGYAKDSPEYKAAQEALKSTNQLMSRTIRGDVPTPEEMAAHDTLIGNVGAIIAGGAAELGGRATAADAAQLNAVTTSTQATGDANTRANEEQPFRIAGMGYQNRVLGTQANVAEQTQGFSIKNAGNQARVGEVAANVAEGTQDAQVTGANNAAALSGINVQLGEAELAKVNATAASTIAALNSGNDLTVNRNAVLKGLLSLEGATQQATYLGQIAAQGEIGAGIVESLRADGFIDDATAQGALAKANRVATGETLQLAILEDQAGITDNERQKSDQTLTSSIDLFNSDADLKLKTNRAESDLLTLRTAGQRAAYLQGIAKLGAPGQAIIDGLKDQGLITPQQASAFKTVAGNAQTVDTATAQGAQVQVDAARFDLSRAKQLFPIELKSAQAALDMAGQQLAAFKENRPVNLEILKANLATINQALDQNGQLFGPRLDAARLQVKQLESELRVAQGTEQARIDTATAGATTAGAQADVATGTVDATIKAANAQATSADAAAQVDVATIPTQIEARKVSVQQAQAALTAQLTENRFADVTFARRVKAIDLNNSTSTQQLLALKQQYSQNADKFPSELRYLKAQLAVQQENAKTLAAERVGTDGSVSGDRKTVLSSLDAMRKINADERRLAANNLVNVARRLMPNAKFSIDKYDPKSFTTLVGSTSTLTEEQKAELNNAQLAFDTAASKSSDLSTAFAQISGKGKMDPKVAERLGFFEDAGSTADPYGTQDMGGVKMVTTFPSRYPVPKSFTPAARFEISRTAGRLGVDANALAAVISFETAGSFDPAKKNGGGSSGTGLIQFMEATAKGMGTTTAALKAMPFGRQMEYVERYLKDRGIGPGSSMGDIYQAVAGSGYKRGSAEYEKNKVWDSNNNGVIEPNEQTLNPAFAQHVRDYYGTKTAAGPAAPTPTTTAASTLPPGWTPEELAARATTGGPAPTAKPTDVQAVVASQAQKLKPFYAAVNKAPSAAATQKLLSDQATLLAGGPNAPRALKEQYYNALKAALK